ncbi:ABC transporter permease [Bacillus sp. Y1]|nr:ABC transporter permease [Bacillus sp. Y1]AYA76622.1 ABC transporter permease [Bacillus sp. Y1]
MNKLIFNEILKIIRKRKLIVVVAIMAVLISLFTYAQFREVQRQIEKLGDVDWRTTLQQQIVDTQNRLTSSGISDEWKAQLQIRVQQQQYYLDNNINPAEPGAPTFVRSFAQESITLFVPLLIMIIAADIVSSERSAGTVKLLLTRPVKRWKILLSKYVALLLSISIIVVLMGLLAYLISGVVFGFGGWKAPILTGFTSMGGELNTSNVQLIDQWQYILMEFGLVWFVAIVVGTLSFMLSVLLKSTSASMGVMLAALIAGLILSNLVSSWQSAKYLFMINLDLTGYLAGSAPPVPGMTLLFSIGVLAVWSIIGLLVSFTVFVRQDVY